MKIRKPDERWFEVDGDDAKIKIRALSPGERFKIYDAAYTQEVVYNGATDGSPKLKQVTDKELDRLETAKAVIVDWEHIHDEDDNPMECSPENIVRAVNGIDGFMAFVRECMHTLDDDIANEKRGQEKNLPAT